ncbi:MAG: alpha-glucosidase [Chitinophagales bacterium]|nr:alpha-glucosidase [Chitinophagales bacterium]
MFRFVSLFLAFLVSVQIWAQGPLTYQRKDGVVSIYSIGNEKPFVQLQEDDFIKFAIGEEKVSSKLGSFRLKDKLSKQYDHPSLDSIFMGKGNLYIVGRIEDKPRAPHYYLVFKVAGEHELIYDVEVYDTTINRLELTFLSTPEEHFMGFGEQFSQTDMKGEKVPIWVEEQGIGRGDRGISFVTGMAGAAGHHLSTYAPLPFFITTHGRAMFMETYCYSEFDFREKDKIRYRTWTSRMQGHIWQGEPKELVSAFTQLNGRMPKPPEWANGFIAGLQGGAQRVTNIVKNATTAGVPITGVWIQDWVGKRPTKYGSRLWWNWEPDSSYGDLKAFCKEMADMDIRVLGYINPFLAPEGKLGKEALAKGFLVKNSKGEAYLVPAGGFSAYMIDLTNSDAANWVKDIIKRNMIGNGMSGWMADFAEWLPYDAVLHSGISAKEYHNIYPMDWAKVNREAIQEVAMEGQIFFFTRSAFIRSAEYTTMMWAGDQLHSYGKHDGLPSTIVALNSSGISGYAFNHSDIGGYTTVKAPMLKYVRSKDLLYRWTEMNAFTPIFRTHEGLKPSINQQFYSDSATLAFFARMANIHKALRPYIKQLSQEAVETGVPVLRHPYLVFPNDSNTIALDYQFMLGDDLMVVPVIGKNSQLVKGYLPQGQWEHAWTGKTFEGGETYEFEVPYGQPAVFYRVGGKNYSQLKALLKGF